MVYKTSAGVCITEFPSNCARFLFLERFPGLTPSHETYIQIKPEIKRQGGWEFWY
jgi:hypothetical protein